MASLLLAADAGVDVVDTAMAPMAGMTSQVSLHALVEAMRGHPRDPGIDRSHLQQTADYWEKTRSMYRMFETGQLAPGSDVYENEMPGGQYTNLYHQAAALGLAPRWREACQMYATVNRMFGDIVKVTPTSKVVGDMALFMVANDLSPTDVADPDKEIAFPESVISLFKGELGFPPDGFPKALEKKVLKGAQPLQGRYGASAPPVDLEQAREHHAAWSGVVGVDDDGDQLGVHGCSPLEIGDCTSHAALKLKDYMVIMAS